MRRIDDHAATRAMLLQQGCQGAGRAGVGEAERFVQHPQRLRACQQQARQAQSFALSLRECASVQVRLLARPHRRQALHRTCRAVGAAEQRAEHDIFPRKQVVLDRLCVASVHQAGAILRTDGVDTLALSGNIAGIRTGKAAQYAQQAGLAGAVGADHAQRAAGLHAESQVGKQATFATDEREHARLQAHVGHLRGWWAAFLANVA